MTGGADPWYLQRMSAGDRLGSVGRREFIALAAASGAALGCGYYAAESGIAFTPWQFPDPSAQPERNVASAVLLACSPHNTQPWFLRVTSQRIDVRAIASRNLGKMDGLRRELHIGLGCAIENAVVAARAVGLEATVSLCPDATDTGWVARIALARAGAARDALVSAIARRHTNRAAYSDEPLSSDVEPALAACAEEQGVTLRLLTAATDCERFRAGTLAATLAIVTDTPMNEDGHRWYRHSHAEIERHRDGLTLDCAGLSSFMRSAGKLLPRPDAASAGKYWIEATEVRGMRAPAFGLLATASNTRVEQLRVGRAYQRIALWAAANGWAIQPLNQLAERADREELGAASPRFGPLLRELLGAPLRTQMLFRIGRPTAEAFRSPRRPLSWVASFG